MIIAFEGIDGSGKGTQANLFVDDLREKGLDVMLMSFPRYDLTDFGKVVKEYLRGAFGGINQVHPKLASILFSLDRWQSKGEIESLLATRRIVVFDRYVHSNIAHQCAKCERLEDGFALAAWIDDVEHRVFRLPRPNIVIQLELPVKIAAERMAARNVGGRVADIHEADLDYLRRVNDWYFRAHSRTDLRYCKWVTVSGVKEEDRQTVLSIDEVAKAVREGVGEVQQL